MNDNVLTENSVRVDYKKDKKGEIKLTRCDTPTDFNNLTRLPVRLQQRFDCLPVTIDVPRRTLHLKYYIYVFCINVYLNTKI